MKTTLLTASACLAALLLPACSGSGGSDGAGAAKTGELVVEITDAPFAHDLVTRAMVQVDRISVLGSGEDDSGAEVLFEGGPIDVDLLDLTNGATQILVRTDVPVGTYDEMRLRVAGGHLELRNGDVFSTDLGNLHLTSTGTSGLKVKVDPAIEVVGDLSFTLLLDFDLTKSFHCVPGNDPLNAKSYKLMPVVRAVNASETGELRGLVQQDDGTGTGTLVGVDAATVYLMPPGEQDPANAVASTMTEPDGFYALMGVEPGTWDVLAVKDPAQGRVDGVEAFAGNVTVVDLEIQ
jgi:hypothetical protein